MNLPWKSALALSLVVLPRISLACGCFAPPTPATPVVQAGERIVFAHDGSTVTAYIQIQYQGAASDFGWLVPMPSVPTLEVGTDELFTKLLANTSPAYVLSTTRDFCGGGESTTTSGIGCGGASRTEAAGYSLVDAGVSSDLGASVSSPLVEQASIGPYDYAVLKADDKTAMLDWLSANHYYVPDATGAAVTPYIHAGAYFLALKLASGEAAGNVVPIVLRYASDLPMIPITLTSVGAIPDMGVLVWLLGDARAIPRNYYHVVLDELPVWNDVRTYPAAAIRAVHAAPKRHGFLTEFAGASTIMSNQLDYPGRFGNLSQLRTLTDPGAYLDFLRSSGFTFDATLFATLEKYLPEPPELIAQGISETTYYTYYYAYAQQSGAADAGTQTFDPAALTDALTTRIVVPDQKAGLLFSQYPYLTRMYTALSPEDMNVDPVFSENPDLPDVPLYHSAQLTYPCEGQPWLRTDGGLEAQFPNGAFPNVSLPPALRIETLREAGAPQVVTDNTAAIAALLGPVDHGSSSTPSASKDGGGCDVPSRFPRNAAGTVLLVVAAIWLSGRRKVAQ